MSSHSDSYFLTTRLVQLLLALLVIIDVVLGGAAVFLPRFYMQWIQPDAPVDEPIYLLQRAGVIWLGYLVLQAIALFRFKRTPEWTLVVAFLRLVEVPADVLYVTLGNGIGPFGTLALIVAPLFNLVVGVFLTSWYFCCGRRILRGQEAVSGG